MQFDIESIERATLDAVAPQRIDSLAGWLLPIDSGTIARARSAVPLRHANMHPKALADIQAHYAARQIACQFRIADVPGLANLHKELKRQGHTAHRPILTQTVRTLDWRLHHKADQVLLSKTPTEAWQSVYFSKEFDAADSAARVQALGRGSHALYGWIQDDEGPLAAGAAAFSQGWVSIHGLRTRQQARGRGLAKQLIAAFFSCAYAQGLERAFLQVEEENVAALQAYQACGFETAWRYHYWRKN